MSSTENVQNLHSKFEQGLCLQYYRYDPSQKDCYDYVLESRKPVVTEYRLTVQWTVPILFPRPDPRWYTY